MDHWLRWVIRQRWWVLLASTLLAAGNGYFAATHLAFDTDPVTMLDEALPFRQVQDRFREEFPGLNQNLVLVVEAETPEQAFLGARDLHEALTEHAEIFPHRFWPGGTDFFADNGLLVLDLADLDRVLTSVMAAQPMLAILSEQPIAETLLELLAQALQSDDADRTQLESVAASVDSALRGALSGHPVAMSWQRMLAGATGSEGPARETILVEPKLDFRRVMAARDAMDALHELRRDLRLDQGSVQLRITGNVALSHEELTSALEGASAAGVGALVVVVVIMGLGLQSTRLTAAALTALIAGFLVTFGVATLTVGTLNLISIAFAVLYIGLAVNYSVHFLLRYREQLGAGLAHHDAIAACGTLLWPALALSAITTAIGFGAFIPTAYSGVAELGLIAACSMGVTLLTTYTLLPALLAVVPPPGRLHADRRRGGSVPVLDGLMRRRAIVVTLAILVALGAAAMSLRVSFDSDPLNLRDSTSESVATLRALLSQGTSGYRNLQMLVDGPDQAVEVAARLNALPQVRRAMSLIDLVPPDQAYKLELIDATRSMMGPDLLDANWQPGPSDPSNLAAAARRLQSATATGSTSAWIELGATLDQIQSRLPQDRDLATRITSSLFGHLPTAMNRLIRSLQVEQPASMADVPPQLRRQWIGKSGAWLLQIAPRDADASIDELRPFITAVRSVDPAVTGTPVLQTESGRAVSRAFIQAVGWALVGIFAMAAIALRSVISALIVMLPLLLGGLATAALMASTDVSFNFANVIAIPLLLGVGVDNGVHLVLRHRAGGMPGDNVLRTHTARAIVIGAATTALSFANLMISPHAGTASMGFVLGAGLILIVLTTLVVLPAILGPSPSSHHAPG